ncbi:hypothetical protein [Hydrogenophaga crassostreae]|uniref:hypothetical protein n=1 Tax=Hydrogenophaga crassostreae TaxID=1763535 RepID=UPI0012FB43F0|nr:hypothetical protein [Hydrogenophaga crassostreae]
MDRKPRFPVFQQRHQENPMHRRQFASLALSGVATMALSACGGGSSNSSNGDLDLRAAYDRITEGMNHADVDRAVGAPSKDLNETTRRWESGNQSLRVSFVKLNSGFWVAGAVQWSIRSGGELTKSFSIDF